MRKGRPKKRIILPDPKYQDRLVTQFVNNLMFSGKKSIALTIFYEAMDLVEEKVKEAEAAGYQQIWYKRFGEGLAASYLERQGDPLILELFENNPG